MKLKGVKAKNTCNIERYPNNDTERMNRIDMYNAAYVDNNTTSTNYSKLSTETGSTQNEPSVVVNGKQYSMYELSEIIKKYEEEEDKKYKTCYRCGKKYLNNSKYNMVIENLDPIENHGTSMAFGYQSTPYISGITINAGPYKGREIEMCDDCIDMLKVWLKCESKLVVGFNNYDAKCETLNTQL